MGTKSIKLNQILHTIVKLNNKLADSAKYFLETLKYISGLFDKPRVVQYTIFFNGQSHS